ncbi:MAG TPA: hypothetical protein VF350_00375, partial [Candidatus Bathyarchaeia archaeon]
MKSKWDGFRAIPYVKDNLFTLKSRKGKEFKNNFSELEEITHLAKNVVVDREIVIMKQCKVDFRSFQESVSKGKEKGFFKG